MAGVGQVLISGLGKHLQERSHVDPIEHAVGDVRVARQKVPHSVARLRVDDDQTTGAVGEGTGEQDLAGRRQRLEMAQVGGSVLRALLLGVRRVVTADDEQRTGLLATSSTLNPRRKACSLGRDDPQA